MRAYRIHNVVIAADIKEEACDFYRQEIGDVRPGLPNIPDNPAPIAATDMIDVIEELSSLTEVRCQDGTVKTIKMRINEELDNRNAWLRMGVPCELHWPFVIGTLP